VENIGKFGKLKIIGLDQGFLKENLINLIRFLLAELPQIRYVGYLGDFMKATTQVININSPSLTLSATLQIISAGLLAFIILYGVGFAEVDIAHNSAHDARHAAVFPCH